MSFGRNVKIIRVERGLSLQDLASNSNVSVSMLSKIEREEKIPTIRVASQIARALKLPIGYLIGEGLRTSIAIIKKEQRKLFIDPVSNVESFVVSPATDNNNIEILAIYLPEGASTGKLPPAGDGVREYIIVEKGTVTACIDSGTYKLQEGDCILYDANVQHEISNLGSEEVKYYLIIDRYGLKASAYNPSLESITPEKIEGE